MKKLIYILPFVICSCNKSDSKINNLTEGQNSVKIAENIKLSEDQRIKWENYEREQIKFVGLTNPDSVKIEKNDLLFHFKTIGEKSKYFEIVEIYDKFHSPELICKKVEYEIDKDCHPDLGKYDFNKQCIKNIKSTKYKLEGSILDSLYKYLKKKEFWDLNESQSEYLSHNLVRFYHGKVLDYSAYYSLSYPIDSETDTILMKRHRVIRAPMDSEIMTKVNLAIENVLENKMPDDNKW